MTALVAIGRDSVAQRVQARPLAAPSTERKAVAEHKQRILDWLGKKRPLRLRKIQRASSRRRSVTSLVVMAIRVRFTRADEMLRTLQPSRLDNSREADHDEEPVLGEEKIFFAPRSTLFVTRNGVLVTKSGTSRDLEDSSRLTAKATPVTPAPIPLCHVPDIRTAIAVRAMRERAWPSIPSPAAVRSFRISSPATGARTSFTATPPANDPIRSERRNVR
jgi:hypothetical protein